jgi:tRNA threonylcarbamoyladenosine biosynthesis protein TsaE
MIDIQNQVELHLFSKKLAVAAKPGLVVYLQGPLGAGKTTLMQSLLKNLGYLGLVKSPTYSLVETYDTSIGALHHFDLYRLHSPMELYDMGIDDFLSSDACCFIEWPEKGAGVLTAADLVIEIQISSLHSRQLHCRGLSAAGKEIVGSLKS